IQRVALLAKVVRRTGVGGRSLARRAGNCAVNLWVAEDRIDPGIDGTHGANPDRNYGRNQNWGGPHGHFRLPFRNLPVPPPRHPPTSVSPKSAGQPRGLGNAPTLTPANQTVSG